MTYLVHGSGRRADTKLFFSYMYLKTGSNKKESTIRIFIDLFLIKPMFFPIQVE